MCQLINLKDTLEYAGYCTGYCEVMAVVSTEIMIYIYSSIELQRRYSCLTRVKLGRMHSKGFAQAVED